jgi:O-antigen ligase
MIQSSFYNYFLYLCLFFITFSGNATLFEIDFFTVIALVILLFITAINQNKRLVVKCKFNTLLTLTFFFTMLILLYIKSVQTEISYIEYSLWPIKVPILFLILVFIKEAWSYKQTDHLRYLFFFTILGSAVFIISMLIFGDHSGGRISFIFGPNVLYRVLIFFILFMILMLALMKIKKRQKILYSTILLLFLFYLLSVVGSRGGLVVLVIVLTLTFFLKYTSNFRFFAFLLLFSSIFILLAPDLFENSRTFSFQGIEQNIRIVFFLDFYENILEVPIFGYVWSDFEKYAVDGFIYPHNSAVELIFYYGVLGVFTVAFIFYVAILAIVFFMKSTFTPKLIVEYIYILLFLIILFSSFASGELTDNFTIVSFALYGFYYWKSDRVK